MSAPLSHLKSLLPKRVPPVTAGDLWAVAGYAAFAGVLFSPLRHYVGSPKQVKRTKFAQDSFPISTYPMFSVDRKGRVTVPHVVGITADEQRVPLHYRHYGTGGLNQVRKQIARGVRRGDAADIAQRYADSLAATARRREANIVRVLVVRSRFQFDQYFSHDAHVKLPDHETVRAQCQVGGTAELLQEKPS
ncbi:hypothetical protein GCM10009720_20450 [Yaniella flava]|uniref:Uncharacterized protein n=1 Tax=Yaniella flava TaxID=287930 RepID=A0ABN2UM69_9MICC|nr:hypothetical protein [Micrococcaceae bacterium]